ncbi:MAG: hypothetical protein ACFCU1_13335 [Sumerlaeia bacterium]
MFYGFKKVAFGISSAALLSGTAFAVGPTVQAPPTLIITQRVSQDAIDQGSAPFDDSSNTAVTNAQGVYRFTEAFDLSNFVTIASPGDVATLKWDFAELDGPNGAPLAAGQTITINDGTAINAGRSSVPAWADVNSSSFASVDSADNLTFTNTARAGDQTSFEDIAYLELYATSTADSDARVESAEFVVITENNSGLGDRLSAPSTIFTPLAQFQDLDGWSKSFDFNFATNFVITKAQHQANAFGAAHVGGVQIISTNGTTTSLTNDSNWATTTQMQYSPDGSTFVPSTGLIATNNPGLLTPPAVDPGGNSFLDNAYFVTPPGTGSILIRGFNSSAPRFNNTNGTGQPATNSLFVDYAPQFMGFISGRSGQNEGQFVAAAPGDVLMARWYLNDAGTTTLAQSGRQAQISLRMGSQEDIKGMGLALADTIPGGNNGYGIGGDEFRQYFYSHSTGNVYFQVNTQSALASAATANGLNDLILTVDRIDVASFDRADLQGETIVFNQGAPSVTTAAGPLGVPAPAGSVAFDTVDTWTNQGLVGNGFGSRVSYGRTPATGATATRLSITLASAVSLGNNDLVIYGGGWDTVNTLLSATGSGEEAIPMDNGKIYFFDYYLSATPSATLPAINVGFNTSDRGRTGGFNTIPVTTNSEGRQGLFTFDSNNATTTRLDGTTAPNDLSLESAAKRFTLVYEPQVKTGTGLDVRPFVEIYGFPSNPFVDAAYFASGTINIERVVVTEYDAPADVDTAAK